MKSFMIMTAALASVLSVHAGGLMGIRTVSVAEKVAMPKEMGYMGPTQKAAIGFFGAIGAVASLGAKKVPLERYAELGRADGIDVGRLLRGAFVERLKNSRIFDHVGSKPSEGRFELAVEHYALVTAPTAFSRREKPILKTAATLFDKEGRAVWSGSGDVLAGASEVAGADNADYWADPARYKRDWEIVTDVAARRLVEKLQRASHSAPGPKRQDNRRLLGRSR